VAAPLEHGLGVGVSELACCLHRRLHRKMRGSWNHRENKRLMAGDYRNQRIKDDRPEEEMN
jgi:hypothetical protein